MLVVLCHLGDSPMHAEISNTVNPTITLNPCRVCKLQVVEMEEKKTQEFIEGFVGVDHDCLPVSQYFMTHKRSSSKLG